MTRPAAGQEEAMDETARYYLIGYAWRIIGADDWGWRFENSATDLPPAEWLLKVTGMGRRATPQREFALLGVAEITAEEYARLKEEL